MIGRPLVQWIYWIGNIEEQRGMNYVKLDLYINFKMAPFIKESGSKEKRLEMDVV